MVKQKSSNSKMSANKQKIVEREIREVINSLISRDIIMNVSSGDFPRYKFKVDIYRIWLEKYKPKRSISEEGIEW
jgi:hypothetical protein